jgi:hypothetical protein
MHTAAYTARLLRAGVLTGGGRPCRSDVLAEWVFMTTSVTPAQVRLMVDGEDKSSGDLPSCCLGSAGTTMTQDFTSFTFVTDIFIGARADANALRHYAGKVAGVKIHTDALSLAESQAIMDDDQARGVPPTPVVVLPLGR